MISLIAAQSGYNSQSPKTKLCIFEVLFESIGTGVLFFDMKIIK
jgi:hypothetical protein